MTCIKLLLFFAMMAFCSLIGRMEAQSVTKIELGGNRTLQVGKTLNISAVISPSNAANKTLQWESSNVGVVEIVSNNNNGAQVRTDGTGTAWITAKAQDGSGTTGSILITVVSLIKKITLALPGPILDIGVTTRPAVRLEPSDPTNSALQWESSNAEIISVSPSGEITTHKSGTATITAYAEDGSGVSGSLTIRVHRPVKKVRINGGDLTLKVTERQQLSATIQPADASIQTFSWQSNNPSVAHVSSSGYLIAKSEGVATITARSNDQYASYPQGSITVTVKPYSNGNTSVENVAIPEGNQQLSVNDEKQLTALITPNNATNRNVTWSSSNASIVSVSTNGRVKALKAGEATITVTTVDGAKTASVKIKVTAAAVPPPPVIPVTGVSLNKSSLTLIVGGKEVLTVTVAPNHATNRNVTWSSSNATVASVNANGEITAYKAGEAIITVTTVDGNKTASATVKVKGASIPVTGINLNKSALDLSVGDREILTATVIPNHATNRNVTWSSSNEAVASVDTNGEVTAYKAGEAIITVTTVDGNKTASATVKVKGASIPVTGINLNKSALDLSVGDREILTATVIPNHATNRNVTWSSSNEAVASVDTQGEVTAHTAGKATIIATTADGGKTASCKVIVHTTNANVKVDKTITVWSENGWLHIDSPAAETVDIYSISVGLIGRFVKISGKSMYDLHLFRQNVVIVRGSSGWTRKIKL